MDLVFEVRSNENQNHLTVNLTKEPTETHTSQMSHMEQKEIM